MPVTIVVVDDSGLARGRLRGMICAVPGAQIVGEAVSAREAVSLIELLAPDVLILDIRMSSRSGLGLLEDLKNGATRPPTVIVVTNYPCDWYRKRCMELGANFFFDKTKEFVRVREVIRALV
ncbi:MAG: response regulator transcription factor [Gemmatimonadales bacterium]